MTLNLTDHETFRLYEVVSAAILKHTDAAEALSKQAGDVEGPVARTALLNGAAFELCRADEFEAIRDRISVRLCDISFED